MENLRILFQAIAQANDEQGLRSQIEAASQYFVAQRRGLFFFDQLPRPGSRLHKSLQRALSTEHNPVARYLLENHAPVHEGLVTSPKVWQMICPRADHWHVMAGPIVNAGQLVGVIGFTREREMPAFDARNLTDLSALCLHVSTWVATMRNQANQSRTVTKSKVDCLTPRELEIAQLVAQGCTNAEISDQLWITENSVKQALKRMFRKLEVSSRAQMVAEII
ncbi:MAG: LuxR family transcriptional regulator [Anaerolineae bacterium]|nr:LuxR family transcriptional regulator [Gloeobacterales cyanobacterium ES-bin-313]